MVLLFTTTQRRNDEDDEDQRVATRAGKRIIEEEAFSHRWGTDAH